MSKNINIKTSESDNDITLENESDSSQNKLISLSKDYKEESYLDFNDSNNLGKSVENYFFLKLKKCLKAKSDFTGSYSLVDHKKKLNELIIKHVLEKSKDPNVSSDQLKIDGMNLIQQIDSIFGNNSEKVQIDALFPNIKGIAVKTFIKEVQDCCHFSEKLNSKIANEKKYNLIVEITHNILSTINKKSKQLRNYFTIFSKTRKLYLENVELFKQFYLEFLKRFKIVGKEEDDLTNEELIQRSNFIYVICSNKSYKMTKLFQESLSDEKQLQCLKNKLSEEHKKKADETQLKSNEKKEPQKNSKKETNPKSIDNKKKDEEEDKKEEDKKEEDKKEEDKKEEDKKEEEEEQEDEDEFNKKKSESLEKIEEEKNNKINNEIKQAYNPGEYIEKFKNILKTIENENDGYLLVYLDCYENLFVPRTVLASQIKDLIKKYNDLRNVLQISHPEYFKDGKVDYTKIKNAK